MKKHYLSNEMYLVDNEIGKYNIEDGFICLKNNKIIEKNKFINKKNETIPKIFHFIWIGNNKNDKYIESWKKHHVGWEVIEWEEKELKQKYDINHSNLRCLSNIYRLKLIYEYGGIYIDYDIECLKNIESLLIGCHAFTGRQDDLCNNAIFGAIPKHSWIKKQLDLLPKYVNLKPPWGAKLMTESINPCYNVRIFEQSIFYPQHWSFNWNEEWQIAYCHHKWWSLNNEK